MDKKHVIYIHNGISYGHKEDERVPFGRQMNLKVIMLSEMNQKERQMPYDSIHKWNLKKKKEYTNKKQNQTYKNREQTDGLPEGRGMGG